MQWAGLARALSGRRGDVTERARVLKVGGALVALLIAGLVVGFLTLGGNGSPSPSPSSPTGNSATSTDTRAQIEQAYLHTWDVWADSLLRLDPSQLPEVLTGRALEVI